MATTLAQNRCRPSARIPVRVSRGCDSRAHRSNAIAGSESNERSRTDGPQGRRTPSLATSTRRRRTQGLQISGSAPQDLRRLWRLTPTDLGAAHGFRALYARPGPRPHGRPRRKARIAGAPATLVRRLCATRSRSPCAAVAVPRDRRARGPGCRTRAVGRVSPRGHRVARVGHVRRRDGLHERDPDLAADGFE
jgi:hypothetical protein